MPTAPHLVGLSIGDVLCRETSEKRLKIFHLPPFSLSFLLLRPMTPCCCLDPLDPPFPPDPVSITLLNDGTMRTGWNDIGI